MSCEGCTFDLHTSKDSERLKVVLLHLWRVNVKTISGFICIALGIFTQFNSRRNTITNCTLLNIGCHNTFIYIIIYKWGNWR